MKIFKPIRVTLKDPEQNACDDSTLLSSDSIENTYAILDNSGQCIEAKYKGIICLPRVVQYDIDYAVIEIEPNLSFTLKLKIKEYAETIC